jgi:6-phosphogluconolactonase
MKMIETALAFSALAAASVAPAVGFAGPDDSRDAHAVFVMTNDADGNQVIAFERTRYGTLVEPRKYSTGGRGSGGKIDPLASQGSLTLSEDRSVLLAVNAGSGTLSAFRVFGSHLILTDRVPTGGSEPNAVAQHGKLVYVLNTAGSSSVVGFELHEGKLARLGASQRFLSGNDTNSASIAFSTDGHHLVVTERASNKLDVFQVLPDGRLSDASVNASVGPGAFAVTFGKDTAIVAETGPGGPNSSGMSSYSIGSNNTLIPVSASVPTLGTANCWNVVTPDGRFVYASNSGSSSISGFQIGTGGALTPIPGTVVGLNPSGSTNLDITISSDGDYLYSLNAASGAIGIFAIRGSDGSLTNLGTVGGLPAGAGLNGIAAN